MGRKRESEPWLLKGLRVAGERLFWQPTSARERVERKASRQRNSEALGAVVRVNGRIQLTREQRVRWAELSGYRDQGTPGTVGELCAAWRRDGVKLQPNGLERADDTVAMYLNDLEAVEERFGAVRYGKNEIDASRGQAIGTADVQRWVAECHSKSLGNRRLAVLNNVFMFAIRRGRTTYNPCSDVVKNFIAPREREPLPWEVEVLRTLAGPLVGLQMDFEAITGWRVRDILNLRRAQCTADGVKLRQSKSGKRDLWEWTPELRRIVLETTSLPGATAFPASPVFPSRRGGHQAYNTFNANWQALRKRANAMLATCAIPLSIVDLHFHDLRSKAHDDAEEAGQQGHEFLGNTAGVAKRHYRRRERRMRPLR